MKSVGIDPGSNGGICVIEDRKLAVHKMPEVESDVFLLLRGLVEGVDVVVLEKVGGYVGGGEVCPTCYQPRNQSPGSSMFNFGRGVGIVVGCLHALGVKFIEVEPQRWQLTLGLKRPKDMKPEKWKGELKRVAQQLYPQLKTTLWSADAILLARYAQLTREGFAAPEPLE